MNGIFKALLFLLLITSPSLAEDNVSKWCKEDKVRYSNSNLTSKGFTQCGEIAASKLCDASGNKFFGKSSPHAVYKDCSIGPRIKIERHDPLPAVESSDVNMDISETKKNSRQTIDNSNSGPGLLKSNAELKELKNAMDSYNKNYDQYLKSIDASIDGKEMPKNVEDDFRKSQEDLRKVAEDYGDIQW